MSDTEAPRVSVICIFYNAERYFVEAIESVLVQEFQDFELLLADDGSQDGSTAIAQAYCAKYPGRIRYLAHEAHVNLGMSATRNLGLVHARGEFVAFIDSDDRWRPRKLREQISIMDSHPELGGLAGAANYWRSWNGGEDCIVQTGHAQDRVLAPPEATVSLYPLGQASAPPPSDLLLRRAVVERVGGFEAHFTGPRQMYEDQGFLSKLYLEAPVYFSSSVWLDYRQHDNSCVSVVTREGLYDEVRTYFLDWFERYLSRTAYARDPRVRQAFARAARPYRRPRVAAGLDFAKRVARRAQRATRFGGT